MSRPLGKRPLGKRPHRRRSYSSNIRSIESSFLSVALIEFLFSCLSFSFSSTSLFSRSCGSKGFFLTERTTSYQLPDIDDEQMVTDGTIFDIIGRLPSRSVRRENDAIGPLSEWSVQDRRLVLLTRNSFLSTPPIWELNYRPVFFFVCVIYFRIQGFLQGTKMRPRIPLFLLLFWFFLFHFSLFAFRSPTLLGH